MVCRSLNNIIRKVLTNPPECAILVVGMVRPPWPYTFPYYAAVPALTLPWIIAGTAHLPLSDRSDISDYDQRPGCDPGGCCPDDRCHMGA